MKKRVKFANGKQEKFFKNVKIRTNFTWRDLSNRIGVNESTLSKSYRFGLCDVPYSIFKKIIKILNKREKDILKNYNATIIEEKLVIGRKVFGERKKQLNQIKIDYFNENIYLDISKINFSKYDQERNIKLPNKITPELSEEIGMHYGDGFLSDKRYEYRLKGNPLNEKEYYTQYIKPLFKRLYNVDVNLKDFKTSYGFELKSRAIWEFKVRVLGIKPGNKLYLFIPKILKTNNINILSSFLRGLFDTDGCICFKSRYGYKNYYPSIEIGLISKKVIEDIFDILKMLGFDPKIFSKGNYQKITLNGISQFKKYEEIIGWSSPKNLNKVKVWKDKYPQLIK